MQSATFGVLRQRWLDWLKNDPVQSISKQIYGMMRDDATFRAINEARSYTTGGNWLSQNGALARFVDSSYVAGQALALSKLVEGGKDVISLGRLIDEIKKHRTAITRRDYLAVGNLPYDYEPVVREAMKQIARRRRSKGDAYYSGAATSGPQSWSVSKRQHEVFDQLSGRLATERKPDDCLSEHIVLRLEEWLATPEIKRIRQIRHKLIAHAADEASRLSAKSLPGGLTLNEIEAAHRTIYRTFAAISGTVLYDEAHVSPVPVPQDDQFKFWDRSLVPAYRLVDLHKHWDDYEEQRSNWTAGLHDDLFGRA